MVAVVPSVGLTFLKSCSQLFLVSSLGLSKSLGTLTKFPWVVYLGAIGKGQESMKTRVNTDLLIGLHHGEFVVGIKPQTQVPARRPSDDSAALDFSFGQFLLVVSDLANSGNENLVVYWLLERVRKRNRVEFVPDALESWFLG